jgi:hypothetical protein
MSIALASQLLLDFSGTREPGVAARTRARKEKMPMGRGEHVDDLQASAFPVEVTPAHIPQHIYRLDHR